MSSKRFLLLSAIVFSFMSDVAAQITSSSAEAVAAVGGDSVYMFPAWSNARVVAHSDSEAQIEWFAFDEAATSFITPLKTTANVTTDTLQLTEPSGIMARITSGDATAEYRCWVFVPEIDSVTMAIDSVSCTGLFVRAQAYGQPMRPYNTAQAAYTEIAQRFIYNWYIADTLTMTTNITAPTLDSPMSDGELVVVARNQAGVCAEAADSVESYGVRAKYSHTVREREVPNEVAEATAYSAPVEVEFTNESKGDFTVSEWVMGSATRMYDRDPVYTFQQTGTYTVTLIVTNENSGCSSADSTTSIVVTDAELGFPEAFTPNGDGVNDEFRPAYKSLRTYSLTIYNRWGRKVYSTTDPATGWDGKIGNSDAAEGVYMYVAEATGYDDGIRFERKGTITLIR